MGDSALGHTIDVESKRNAAQVYTMPFQHAIDVAISRTLPGPSLPERVFQYPYTTASQKQRDKVVISNYANSLIGYLAFAFFVGMCGVTYHLTGQMAFERELGMTQLIEVMMASTKRWKSQAARFISYHIAFDVMYGPAWFIIGIIVQHYAFPNTNVGIHMLLVRLRRLLKLPTAVANAFNSIS